MISDFLSQVIWNIFATSQNVQTLLFQASPGILTSQCETPDLPDK